MIALFASHFQSHATEFIRGINVSQMYFQNYLNSLLNDVNGTVNENIPGWLPEDVKKKYNGEKIQIKLLCGADLLESFAVPGLWDDEDVRDKSWATSGEMF